MPDNETHDNETRITYAEQAERIQIWWNRQQTEWKPGLLGVKLSAVLGSVFPSGIRFMPKAEALALNCWRYPPLLNQDETGDFPYISAPPDEKVALVNAILGCVAGFTSEFGGEPTPEIEAAAKAQFGML